MFSDFQVYTVNIFFYKDHRPGYPNPRRSMNSPGEMPPDRRVDVRRASPPPRDRGHDGEAAHEVRDHVTHPHAGQHGHLARGLGWSDGVAVEDQGLPHLGDQSVECMRGF